MFRLPKSLWRVCFARFRKSSDVRRLWWPALTSFLDGVADLGLTDGDLCAFSWGVVDVGERRDAVEGEGVADITCPFLNEEDVSESFDTLRTSGGEFSRAGVGVDVNGSCFW